MEWQHCLMMRFSKMFPALCMWLVLLLPQPAFSPCPWMDQDPWPPWLLVISLPCYVPVSTKEFIYSEWTTAEGWNFRKWQPSEAKTLTGQYQTMALLFCVALCFSTWYWEVGCRAGVLFLGPLRRHVRVRCWFKSSDSKIRVFILFVCTRITLWPRLALSS